MRKILQIGKFYPPHRGGMESHLELLCDGLSKFINVEVLAFSYDGRTETVPRTSGPDVTLARVDRIVAGAPLSKDMIRCVRERAGRADLIHVHHPNPMANLAVLLSGYKGPIIVTYHSDVIRQRVFASALAPLFDLLWKRTAAFIVQSPNYIHSSPILAGRRDQCRVIPSAIETRRYEQVPTAEVATIRSEHGERILLAVGRMVGYKGHTHLLRAMRFVDAKLLLLGSGPLRNTLEAEAIALGVEHKVRFLGTVENVVPYYHACDVFVLPSISRAEAFGLVQVEAMACGKPVVNTALCSGVPFVSPDGATGLTVPPGDPGALASAVNVLLADKALRVRLGERARERARAEFDAEIMVERTFALYREVISKHACSRDAYSGRRADGESSAVA